jgi:glucoamylase
VYLSGNYSALGTGMKSSQDWNAAEIPMIKTGPDTWSLTISAAAGAQFQYKFDLGNWASVEETSSCGYVSNRTLGFGSAGSSSQASDTVAAWAGIGGC